MERGGGLAGPAIIVDRAAEGEGGRAVAGRPQQEHPGSGAQLREDRGGSAGEGGGHPRAVDLHRRAGAAVPVAPRGRSARGQAGQAAGAGAEGAAQPEEPRVQRGRPVLPDGLHLQAGPHPAEQQDAGEDHALREREPVRGQPGAAARPQRVRPGQAQQFPEQAADAHPGAEDGEPEPPAHAGRLISIEQAIKIVPRPARSCCGCRRCAARGARGGPAGAASRS